MTKVDIVLLVWFGAEEGNGNGMGCVNILLGDGTRQSADS